MTTMRTTPQYRYRTRRTALFAALLRAYYRGNTDAAESLVGLCEAQPKVLADACAESVGLMRHALAAWREAFSARSEAECNAAMAKAIVGAFEAADARALEEYRAVRSRAAARWSASERKAHSADEVRGNIPEELVAVWEAVKNAIKASERRSRTEAFLEWVHDHPADVQTIRDRAIEASVDDLIREEEQQRMELEA